MQYLVPIAVIAALLIISEISYKKTTYYYVTHNSMLSMCFDAGKHGEYLIYKKLRSYEKEGAKFLFNVYLDKQNNETTEIDVLLINENGVFVFESKNYSGWIFGDEKQKTWTQCLPQGKNRSSHKEHFLNPIFQNNLHISVLKEYLRENIPVHSIISFSERCTLKKVTVTTPTIRVVKRNDVRTAVSYFSEGTANKLTKEQIEQIYNTIFPYSQVSEDIKQTHIENILENHQPQKRPKRKESPIQEDAAVCPRCGGKLVLRTASSGPYKGNQFYGCSNYPQCRYIKNL